MDTFIELNALRGLTPRQQRLLDLAAVLEDTQYDHLEDWGARDLLTKDPLPCEKRKPEVMLGIASEKAKELVRLLTGEKMRPQVEDIEAVAEEVPVEALMRELPLAVMDGLRGSCALGVVRVGDAATGEFELVQMDPTWCEPIFAAQAAGSRAEQVAQELALLGVPVEAPAPGAFLKVPAGSKSHDLCFLRYEWIRDEELSSQVGSHVAQTVRWRYRRDYLPNVIVEYKPIRITASEHTVPAFEPVLPYRPHNWGVVPVAWARSPYAKPGDYEGPSFLTPAMLSCATKADYIETKAGDSVSKIAFPQLALIDAKDRVAALNEELGQRSRPMPSGSGHVLDLKSTGNPGTGRADVLEISAEGPKVAAEYVQRLQRRVEQVTGLVDYDQAMASGTMSGVALERMMQPLIATVGEWRVMVTDLIVRTYKIVGQILGREVKPVVKWPRVVETTPADLTAAAQALTLAAGGQPIVTRETAARIFARLADIEDPDAEVAALEAEAEELMQREREALQRARTAPTE